MTPANICKINNGPYPTLRSIDKANNIEWYISPHQPHLTPTYPCLPSPSHPRNTLIYSTSARLPSSRSANIPYTAPPSYKRGTSPPPLSQLPASRNTSIPSASSASKIRETPYRTHNHMTTGHQHGVHYLRITNHAPGIDGQFLTLHAMPLTHVCADCKQRNKGRVKALFVHRAEAAIEGKGGGGKCREEGSGG